jgi:hypothetical protein
MTRRRPRTWLTAALLGGLTLLAAGPGEAQNPLTLTLTTNGDTFAAGDRLEVQVAVESAGGGGAADFYLGAILPDGTTVVAFGPDRAPSLGSFATLASLPPLAPGVSLATPFEVPRQPLVEYQWTGSEPPGEYRFFAAALRAGSLADGGLGGGDLLALATRTLRFGLGSPADWHAFADARTVDAEAGALAFIRARAPVVCAEGQPGQAPTLADALARLQAWLEQEAGASALAALANGLGDPARAPLVAAAAVADGKPHAGLAALLVAHQREPGQPTHLVSAAGLASLLGHPAEALALLDAADLLGAAPESPLGVEGRALALNNRGHALLGLGRWAEAALALEEAAALAPALSEARASLSLALLCQGTEATEARALRLFRAGRWRTPGPAVPIDPGPAEPPAQAHPTVTIAAVVPVATEAPLAAGLLTVRRTGETVQPLTVRYQVSGTAAADEDYAALAGEVTIPAGASTADLAVLPLPDDLPEGDETVVVALTPDAGYELGTATDATVTIGTLLLPAARVRRVVAPASAMPEWLALPPVFDVSAGVEAEFPPVPFPDRPEQLPAFRPIYQAIDAQFSAYLTSRGTRLGEIYAARQAQPPLPPLSRQRIHDTFIALYTYRSEPPFQALWEEVRSAQAGADAIVSPLLGLLTSANQDLYYQAAYECGYGPGSDACRSQAYDRYFCQPIRAAHPRWRQAVDRLDAAVRALLSPASRHLTGLAANIADPLYHEEAMIHGVQDDLNSIYYLVLVNEPLYYTQFFYRHFLPGSPSCVAAEEPPPPASIAPPVVTDPGACPPALTAAKLQVRFAEVLSVAFNCESVELEVSEPGLGLFGQIGFTQRPGQRVQATVFVGVKASIPGLGLGAKEGFYLRADSQSFTDAGFKVSASNLIGAPVGGIKVESPFNMEFGIAAAAQYIAAE